MTKQNKEVLVLVTGGTFDKTYDMLRGELYFKDTHLLEMFERGRATMPTVLRTLMMIDSLMMLEQDRLIVRQNCEKAEQTRILITHGTDTICETAAIVAQGNIQGKTIVLFGAMIPYTFGSSSDGFFNLGASLAFVQCLPPGVYVCMNGRYFHWDNVRKNKKTGYFETLREE